jgi:lactate oxidase
MGAHRGCRPINGADPAASFSDPDRHRHTLENIMDGLRRRLLHLGCAGLATASSLSTRVAGAQVREVAGNEPGTLLRPGTDREIEVINTDLLEEQARQILAEGVYVFIAHGTGEQWTLRENRRAFADYVFTPHRMRGIDRNKIDTSLTMLGQKFPHPIFISPMGGHGLVHPDGEIATARGAGKSGGLLCVSSASTRSMEEIASVTPSPKWFQMYLSVDAGESRAVLQRARDAGFKVVILTIDAAVGQGSSDEYVRLGRKRPSLPSGNYPTGNAHELKTDLSWADLEFVQKTTGLPVVIKGITRHEDATAAVKAGAAAIQVSNHGGRSLDGLPASISVLPRIVDAVRGDVPIIMDGGIRRGADIAKALALGADAVAVGRPVWWALAVGGAGGVGSLMSYLKHDLVTTMLHCGVDRPLLLRT